MDELNSPKNPGGQTIQASCPKSFKPWIFTLLILGLITLGWVIVESYLEGGLVSKIIGRDDIKVVNKAKQGPSLYTATQQPVVGSMQGSYHSIIEMVRPAVVSIDVAVTLPEQEVIVQNPAFGAVTPRAGAPVANYTRVGSGVIISDSGYVLTSYHLVENATSLKGTVYGPGGGQDYPLKLVNVDKATDLALLRLLGSGPFAHAILGDSDAVRTGDMVLAMGSPFGFDNTITTGIISSRNRTVTIGGRTYEGLLQTDTPINRGNSGGPLVNLRGEVIGINTAIYSPSGTFSGIGFAIPINSAAALVGGVVDFGGTPPNVAGGQLAAWARQGRQTGNSYKLPNGQIIIAPHPYRGKCIDCHPQLCTTPGQGGGRGLGLGLGLNRNPLPIAAQTPITSDSYLGATLIDVDSVIAKQFKLPHAGGVLVDNVIPGAPAGLAGLQRGDIIIRVDGKRVKDVAEMQTLVAAKRPGSKVELSVLSNGSRKVVQVNLTQMPVGIPQAVVPPVRQPAEFGWLGAEITPIPPTLQAYIPSGVYVAEAGGVLAAAGVMKGDVIRSINNRSIPDLLTFTKMAPKFDVTEGFLLDVIRNGRPTYIKVKG
jgi:serine protease Do